jgi:hypothetical protein
MSSGGHWFEYVSRLGAPFTIEEVDASWPSKEWEYEEVPFVCAEIFKTDIAQGLAVKCACRDCSCYGKLMRLVNGKVCVPK